MTTSVDRFAFRTALAMLRVPSPSCRRGDVVGWRLALHVVLVLVPTLLFLALVPAVASATGRTVLIVAPHPDDEILFGAGVETSALAAGDTV